MQALLTTLAAEQQVELISVGNTPTLEIAGARYAGMRAEIAGTVEAIHGFIFAVETARPLLIIREATLWAANADEGSGQPPTISAQFVVTAALSAEAAKSAKAIKP